MFDFLSEYRNNTPIELYAVADNAYAVGLSGFLANELGFILKGVYITDDPPESHIAGIREVAAARDESFPGMLAFEVDSGAIQQDMRQKLGQLKRALFLGSSWEKLLTQKTGNLYTFISVPIQDTVIINKSFARYPRRACAHGRDLCGFIQNESCVLAEH